MEEEKRLLEEDLEMVSGGTGEDAEAGMFDPIDYHPEYGHFCRKCHNQWSSRMKDERCFKCGSDKVDSYQIK